MFASPVVRVRAMLDSGIAPFKKLLPRGLAAAVPALETQRYPSGLLGVLPAAERYSFLGIIAEELLRLPAGFISPGSVVSVLKKCVPATTDEHKAKILKSKTTQPFCDALNETARQLRAARDPAAGHFSYDRVVEAGRAQGHPDIRTATQIFEVKLTGRLKENWTYFLCQVFAYAALDSAVKEVALVLPLQKTVWRYSLATADAWPKRAEYAALLQSTAARLLAPAPAAAVAPVSAAALGGGAASDRPAAAAGPVVMDLSGFLLGLLDPSGAGLLALASGLPTDRGAELRESCLIGSHIAKQPTLAATFRSAPDVRKPWQIFLGGPQTSKFKAADADIAAGAAVLAESRTRFFVHSQYIINLCKKAEDGDAWHTDLLRKNLEVAVASGCRGVVVHVGKSTGQDLETALATMRDNILAVLPAATPDCPLLLETPAGQGTEVLTDADAFIAFVASFADERLRICVDTCHTFVCGHDPLDYIKKLTDGPAEHRQLLRLIHYNDSAVPCGCRKDRHAFMGTGHIGMEKMEAIARHCHAAGLPMVIE